MKIATLNAPECLTEILPNYAEVVSPNENFDSIFIDWKNTSVESPDKSVIDQIEIINKTVKKKDKKIVIFDRFSKITEKEKTYLLNSGTFLMEPFVIPREGFNFQPIFGKVPKTRREIPLYENERKHDLAIEGPITIKMEQFKKYYKELKGMGDYSIVVNNSGLNTLKKQVFEDEGIEIDCLESYEDAKVTILIGTDEEYIRGKLDLNIFKYLENGIIPLLPKEHRFYHGLFDGLVVNQLWDIEHVIKLWKGISFGTVVEIYENIVELFPEMDVETLAKRITS